VTERVSVDSSGAEANGDSFNQAVSADGAVVAFHSVASNLTAGDTNGVDDIFVRDRVAGTTDRVSVDSSGVESNGKSQNPSITADGQVVAFDSDARNLVFGDTNSNTDVFAHDRSTGVTTRASIDTTGVEGNNFSAAPSISDDARTIAFYSLASNLVLNDTNPYVDAFVSGPCDNPASWSNYGAGFSGSNGVPTLTSQNDPALGTTITLDIGNSLGLSTVGVLFLGFNQANIHSTLGGDLLLIPTITQLIGIPASGLSVTGFLPLDGTLCGLDLYLQVIEADSGATKGVSFTRGLGLDLGR
jgi:hypothetical protein